MRLEDVFRFLESRMPALQGPDGTLRRSVSLVAWKKIQDDLTEVVKKAGGIQSPAPIIPRQNALVVVEEPEDDAPTVPDVNPDTHPIIEPEHQPRAFL